jgi:hypothetical protein
LLLCLFCGTFAAAQQNPQNVLILFNSPEAHKNFLDSLAPAVRAHIHRPVTFYEAYLSNDREEGEEARKAYEESQVETFRRTYAHVMQQTA